MKCVSISCVRHFFFFFFCAMHAAIRRCMLLTQRCIPPQTKTEPPPKRSRLMTHAWAKTLSPTAINSIASVGMAKVKPTFIGKQNQTPISMSEAQVTVAPIPPCRLMTSGEKSTEVRSVRTNRLNVLSQSISDNLWMNTILSSCCCCS